jgi:hypothetical protein
MNPNVSAAINAVVALAAFLAAMKPDMLPGYVPQSAATYAIQTAGFLVGAFGAVNAALHLVSTSAPGALGK